MWPYDVVSSRTRSQVAHVSALPRASLCAAGTYAVIALSNARACPRAMRPSVVFAVSCAVCVVGVARAQVVPSISATGSGMTVALPATGSLMIQQGSADAVSVATTDDVTMAISTLTDMLSLVSAALSALVGLDDP